MAQNLFHISIMLSYEVPNFAVVISFTLISNQSPPRAGIEPATYRSPALLSFPDDVYKPVRLVEPGTDRGSHPLPLHFLLPPGHYAPAQ
jgi:hypothetical protein